MSALSTVVATITGEGQKDLVNLTIDTDGDTGNQTATITATAAHPFWEVNSGLWSEASELTPGDVLRSATGVEVPIVKLAAFDKKQRVYNLTIGGPHTYYVTVGAADALVHNSCPRNSKGQFTSGENPDAARGRAVHESYRNTLGDDYVFEYRLPSGGRPDAINWKTRTVRELKSDAGSSMYTGRRQLERYVAELEAMTGEKWTGVLDIYSR